ncbi:MAG: hypothetical protein ACOC1F_02890 [Myxococcota bacterium]
MSNQLHSLVIPAVTALAASCATFPPPEERKPEAEPALLTDEPTTTAEWLFATAEGEPARDDKAKCEKVAKWLQGEKECTGEICIHARDMGREWIQKCQKHLPDRVPAMQNLIGAFEERSDLPPDACIREGTSLLRTQSCGEPEACEEQTQKWIARCGPRYATPLFIVMLTRTLQRRFPDDPNLPVHKVEFDPRSCDVLAKLVENGVGCDGTEACRLAVEAADAWMARCYSDDTKVPIQLAFRMVDVRVGGNHGVDPIPVNPLERRLPDNAFPLLLDDNRGLVTWVCGVRPKDLDGYLKTRKGCKPGEVIVARIDAANNVRSVSVPHTSDEEFVRLFPFLSVKGEREARALTQVEGFRGDVAQAVEQAGGRHPEEAIATLARALRTRDWTIARRGEFQKILTDADAALVPAFEAWGKLKAKRVYRVRDREQRAMYAGRALRSPLHDTGLDGTVQVGAYAAPWPLSLHTWMPSSFAAYRDAVDSLERTASRDRPSADRVDRLRLQVLSEIRACGKAEQNVQSAIDEVMDCMFAEGGCTQDEIRTLASKADPGRERAARARETILKILTTGLFPKSEVERLEAERLSSGCLDP